MPLIQNSSQYIMGEYQTSGKDRIVRLQKYHGLIGENGQRLKTNVIFYFD